MTRPKLIRGPDEKLSISIPFAAVHVLALSALFVQFRWWYPLAALVSYYVRMFFMTAGYHRYFAHRAYKTSRWFAFVLGWGGATCTQKGPLWWAANHRFHHKHSDQPDDIHSPSQRGIYWAHVGWTFCRKYDPTHLERIKDFAHYPEIRWLNKWHLVPPVLYALGLYLVGGAPLLVWGYFVSQVLLWHGTFTINSLSHVFGTTRYPTTDTSKNNFILALITCGEGWHNNHHHYPSTANQGFFWWEIDFSYYGLKLLSWIGVVHDLRKPPPALLMTGTG